jgi:hypothetical protein
MAQVTLPPTGLPSSWTSAGIVSAKPVRSYPSASHADAGGRYPMRLCASRSAAASALDRCDASRAPKKAASASYGAGPTATECRETQRMLNQNVALGRAPGDGDWIYVVVGSQGTHDGYLSLEDAVQHAMERPLDSLSVRIVPSQRIVDGAYGLQDVLADDALQLQRLAAGHLAPRFVVNPLFTGQTAGPDDPFLPERPLAAPQWDLINAPVPGAPLLLECFPERQVDLVIAAADDVLALYDRLCLPPREACLAVLVRYDAQAEWFIDEQGRPMNCDALIQRIAAHPAFEGQQVLLLACSTHSEPEPNTLIQQVPARIARGLGTYVTAADKEVVLMHAGLPSEAESAPAASAGGTPAWPQRLLPSVRVGLAGEGRFVTFGPDGTPLANAREAQAGRDSRTDAVPDQTGTDASAVDTVLVHAAFNTRWTWVRSVDERLRRLLDPYTDTPAEPIRRSDVSFLNERDFLVAWRRYGSGPLHLVPIAFTADVVRNDRRERHTFLRNNVGQDTIEHEIAHFREPRALAAAVAARQAEAAARRIDLVDAVLEGRADYLADMLRGVPSPGPRGLHGILRLMDRDVLMLALAAGRGPGVEGLLNWTIYRTLERPQARPAAAAERFPTSAATAADRPAPTRSAPRPAAAPVPPLADIAPAVPGTSPQPPPARGAAPLTEAQEARIAQAMESADALGTSWSTEDPSGVVGATLHGVLLNLLRSDAVNRDAWLEAVLPLADELARQMPGSRVMPDARGPYTPPAQTFDELERLLGCLEIDHPDRPLLASIRETLHGLLHQSRNWDGTRQPRAFYDATWSAMFSLQRLLHALFGKLAAERIRSEAVSEGDVPKPSGAAVSDTPVAAATQEDAPVIGPVQDMLAAVVELPQPFLVRMSARIEAIARGWMAQQEKYDATAVQQAVLDMRSGQDQLDQALEQLTASVDALAALVYRHTGSEAQTRASGSTSGSDPAWVDELKSLTQIAAYLAMQSQAIDAALHRWDETALAGGDGMEQVAEAREALRGAGQRLTDASALLRKAHLQMDAQWALRERAS